MRYPDDLVGCKACGESDQYCPLCGTFTCDRHAWEMLVPVVAGSIATQWTCAECAVKGDLPVDERTLSR